MTTSTLVKATTGSAVTTTPEQQTYLACAC
jgi:hypothetical protein